MTPIQTAWLVYGAGTLGCTIAAWWMFLWAWRFVRYSAVVTVLTILVTPFAIDPETMQMAPAMFRVFFEGLGGGIEAIKPVLKLMLGIWLILEVLVLLLVVLIRPKAKEGRRTHASNRSRKSQSRRREYEPELRKVNPRKGLSNEEYDAREELMSESKPRKGEIPIRAVRDW